jgi:hypothetical protein
MTRKRSCYRQRPVMGNPLALMRPADKAARDRVMARFLTALEAMARGEHPGNEEWRDLSDAINTVETLTLTLRKLESAQVMPTVTAAIAAMVGAAKRFQAGQRMGLSGEGLQALRDVLAIYEQCLEGLTEREMVVAQAETQRRVNLLLHARRPNHQVIAL